MEKICIIYDSKHNMNTEKLVLSLKETYNDVDIIKVNNFDINTINNYQKVGLASGIYWGKFSKNILSLKSDEDICINPNYPRILYFLQANISWFIVARKNKLKFKDLFKKNYNK